MINFISSRDFSVNGFRKAFWTSRENFFGFWRFFPHGSHKCVLGLRTIIVKKSESFGKRLYVHYIEPEQDCFGFSSRMCQKGRRNCIPRVQRIILLENLLFEILYFYIFFPSLVEVILFFRQKSASRIGEFPSYVSSGSF